MKKLLPFLVLMVLFGCSKIDDKNITLICVGESDDTTVNEYTKSENKSIAQNYHQVYKIENGKYYDQECKFTKDEIVCDTSKPDENVFGEIRFNRVTGSISSYLSSKNKNGHKPIWDSLYLKYNGTCEKVKENKF